MNTRLGSSLPTIKKHLLRTIKIKWDKILKNPAKNIKNCHWNFGYLMQMFFYGFLSGCKNLRELETFTEIYDNKNRIPDTTMQDKIIKIEWEPLVGFLASGVKEAAHNHELDLKGFPYHQMAIDGKSVSISKMEVGEFSQRIEKDGKTFYNNRVLRAMSVSSEVKLFMGQRAICGKTAETSELIPFLSELEKFYGNTNLMDVISVDAGMTSKDNADYIRNIIKKHYIMALKGPQQKLLSNAEYLFSVNSEATLIEEENKNGKSTVRKLSRWVVPIQYNGYPLDATSLFLDMTINEENSASWGS